MIAKTSQVDAETWTDEIPPSGEWGVGRQILTADDVKTLARG
jgi:hypothetical protein